MERIQFFDSRDPFVIAKDLGIDILYHEIGEVYGYYCQIDTSKFIILNESLDSQTMKFTCAHELGHALLHPNELTPTLTKERMVSNLKIEREANEFATKLLIDGRHEEYNINSVYQLLDFYGLPHEMERFVA